MLNSVKQVPLKNKHLSNSLGNLSPPGPGPKKKNVLQRSDSFPPLKDRPFKIDIPEISLTDTNVIKSDTEEENRKPKESKEPNFLSELLKYLMCQKITLSD